MRSPVELEATAVCAAQWNWRLLRCALPRAVVEATVLPCAHLDGIQLVARSSI